MDILWSVLLMLGLAIVLGVLIVLFSILFHVEEDPRVAAVEKMLPNYNCGACGKAGCVLFSKPPKRLLDYTP